MSLRFSIISFLTFLQISRLLLFEHKLALIIVFQGESMWKGNGRGGDPNSKLEDMYYQNLSIADIIGPTIAFSHECEKMYSQY